MPTLEQRRAKFALEKIEEIKSLSDKDRAKYKTQLLKLPARLHSNGLGQTVAFYLSAGPGKPETVICDWLQSWLVGEQELYPPQALVNSLAGIGLRQGMDPESRYRTASTEARALAVWLKRFAEAFIAGEGDAG